MHAQVDVESDSVGGLSVGITQRSYQPDAVRREFTDLEEALAGDLVR